MIAPFSLTNVLTDVAACLCLYALSFERRGATATLWQLAVPPCFALVSALLLLADVFDATPLHDAYWIAGGLLGGIAGQVRFRAFYIRIVSSRTLAHFPATYGSTLVAAALVALSFIDSLSAFRRVPVVPPQYVSGGASVCAWFLCSRAWSAAVQVLAISKSTGNPP